MEQYIIGGLGTLIVGMCGAIWRSVGKLEDKFDSFSCDCRTRHDNVLTKGEFWHEHSPLEQEISELRRIIDRCDACKEVAERR